MKPEIIIVLVVGLVGLYIFIQLNITNRKIKGKTSAKSLDNIKNNDKLELKTVVAPRPDPQELENKMRISEEEAMRRAALESIEDERRWKESILKSEELRLETESKGQQSDIDKKLKEMQEKLDKIDFTIEEQNFVDEVNNLSPELKAILFAELLKRKSEY